MDLLSFDNTRVFFNLENKTVIKRTSKFEFQQIVEGAYYLNKVPLKLECGISVKAAPALEWSNGELHLKLCEGMNLEHALKYATNKTYWSMVIKQLLKSFHERGFLWGDIAPRNMIFNRRENTIYLIDFERPLVIEDKTQTDSRFSEFFRNYAYEELCCLLPRERQMQVFSDFLTDCADLYSPALSITSRRKTLLLNEYFGAKPMYTLKELFQVEDVMAYIASPIMTKGKVVYPMHVIETILEKGGNHVYSTIVKTIINSAGGDAKITALAKLHRQVCFNG